MTKYLTSCRTQKYAQGQPTTKELLESKTQYAIFLFENCALGARLLYGTTSFIVALATFLMGYRQIMLAATIQNIVKTHGDLVSDDMLKRADRIFGILMATLILYFIGYLLVTSLFYEGKYLIYLSSSITILNILFTLAGVSLYLYTIMMLRSAISQCASF